MRLNTAAVERGCGNSEIKAFRHLCRAEIDRFREAAKAEGPLTVACTQEAPLFGNEAGERPEPIEFVNIRETAGWSTQGADAGPKMAALLAAAAEPVPEIPFVTLSSDGVILIYGRDEGAIEAGKLLADHLDVTVMINKPSQITPPSTNAFPVVKGTVRNASGHFGAFELTIDDFAAPRSSSRDALVFDAPRNGATSRCDLLLDLSGGPALFPAHDLRDGYLRADPKDPAAILRAVLKARDLVGSFDKPQYINFTAELCAHSRSKLTGCHRCLDLCPTGAIVPNGDHVKISAEICAGCGQCAAACPTSAASYALPPADALLQKLRAMLLAYRQAGGTKPVMLLHDGQHGTALIEALARHGDGLPANVLPLAVNEITQVGLEAIAAAFAYGAGAVRFTLTGPTTTLPPKSAVAFALAVHELCTNAAKYGALAAESGHVTIGWDVVDADGGPRLKFTWQESGGPAVVEPTHRGFGSRLLERGLSAELKGEVRLGFPPQGLVCTIDAPAPADEPEDLFPLPIPPGAAG